jgi:hypothetical protein
VPAPAAAKEPIGELRATETIAVPGGGAIHRLQQTLGGHPVLGGELIVADPQPGPAFVVADHALRHATDRRTAGAPRLGRERAIARAADAADVVRLRARPQARLMIARDGALVWEARLPAARPLGDFLVLVDAASGRVTQIRDLLRRASGSALLYVPNPIVTQGGDDGLLDRRDRSSPTLDALRVAVELPRLESPRGCLSGAYVDVRLGRDARSVCRPSLNWTNVRRSDDVFEALMAYHHVDRTRAYIESLGLSRGLGPRPQRVRANGIRADNSYFTPFGRGITLGTGGVDDGEDADVIIHEYGHAVQDRQSRLFGQRAEGAAMGEGFGDYLAAVMSSQVSGDPRFDPCMFEWDAISYTNAPCARRTDTALTVQSAQARCFDDPHCVGRAWSSTLWELRGALGADAAGLPVVDRVLLESHLMLTRASDFRDGARALLAADSLLYGGAHRPAIAAELIERGFCRRRGC